MSIHPYPHTKKAFENTIVEKKGTYPYPISPFSGVVDPIDPGMVAEVVEAAIKESSLNGADIIITFESAGAQLAAVVGLALHLPYLVARKKKFNLKHEISFAVETNFDEKYFHVYGDVKGKKILIVDDVVASEATIKNATLAFRKAGASVLALFVVAAKTNIVGRKYQDLLNDINVPLLSLIKIKVVDDRVVVL